MTPEVNDARWRKSSFSGGTNGDCVELAVTMECGLIRDSKNPSGPVLRGDVRQLVAAIKHHNS